MRLSWPTVAGSAVLSARARTARAPAAANVSGAGGGCPFPDQHQLLQQFPRLGERRPRSGLGDQSIGDVRHVRREQHDERFVARVEGRKRATDSRGNLAHQDRGMVARLAQEAGHHTMHLQRFRRSTRKPEE